MNGTRGDQITTHLTGVVVGVASIGVILIGVFLRYSIPFPLAMLVVLVGVGITPIYVYFKYR